MYVAIFVITIVVVVMFHEFGHFATAKLFGMKCEKFFFGFGPTLWSRRWGETEYGVKAIPAGGFVKIVGMTPYEKVNPADAGRTFYAKPAWQRVIVLAAGSATHFVVAIALLFVALTFVGVATDEVTNEIERVIPGSPAAQAGLQPSDEIVAVAGQPVGAFEEVQSLVSSRPGQTIPVEVVRAGQRLRLEVTIGAERPDGVPGGFLGINPVARLRPVPPGEALVSTLSGDYSVPSITAATVEGIGRALSPQGLAQWFGSVGEKGPRSPEGPLSLVGVGQAVNALGARGEVSSILLLLAQLNITFGIVNMAPLPPLDGGHLAVLAIEESVNGARRLRGIPGRWRLDPSVITPLALAVILFLFVIGVTALYVDITKPASQLFQ
jgi:membrane-associated protease RseP (regulator of RpoE activity)